MLYENLLGAIDAAEKFLQQAREMAEVHAYYTMNPHHPEPDKDIRHHASLMRRTTRRNNELIRAVELLRHDRLAHAVEKKVSGYPGVIWDANGRKWRATLWYGGETIYIGLYPTPEQARDARAAYRAELSREE